MLCFLGWHPYISTDRYGTRELTCNSGVIYQRYVIWACPDCGKEKEFMFQETLVKPFNKRGVNNGQAQEKA